MKQAIFHEARDPLFAGCLLLYACGCVSIGRSFEGNPVPAPTADFPKIGVTTKAEVMARLGAPHTVRQTEFDGMLEGLLTRSPADAVTVHLDSALVDEVFVYERARTKRLGVFLGLFNYYRSDTRADRLAIVFDHQAKVVAVGYSPGLREE